MLRMPNPLGDAEADEIVSRFVNDRLIGLMEDAILDIRTFMEDHDGSLDEGLEAKPSGGLADIAELMTDKEFAENVAMAYLPEGYPPQKASQQFFGLYRLLKAKKDYVPELAMEYILFQLIFNEVDDIDTINEYAREGAFDGLEDGPFLDGADDREFSTVLRIPEPDRTVVENAARKSVEGQCGPDELEDLVEYILNQYEDLREYDESCFWDTDFLFLDDMTEEELLGSELNEYLGIGVRRRTR